MSTHIEVVVVFEEPMCKDNDQKCLDKLRSRLDGQRYGERESVEEHEMRGHN